MNLHELVDEYVRIWETLQSFTGHIEKNDTCDLELYTNFCKLADKFDKLGWQIMLQYKSENADIALFEMMRATHLGLEEQSIMKLILMEFEK
ncbi:hypothetical protein JYT57_00175 [Nitrosarchaeum koreense]|nr:hypothetical protein [Nitrosarchaeum koreense]